MATLTKTLKLLFLGLNRSKAELFTRLERLNTHVANSMFLPTTIAPAAIGRPGSAAPRSIEREARSAFRDIAKAQSAES
ncbi:hypothetical protein [Thermosynechococcus sp. PKX82]|uniref:hypothetical protein n=1 Tax=Thermosynechococcus sp. PKX82 TaxID=3074086 RepID=UPI0028730CB1|nr:hypothetical protein [Thermosynechococcus sp. PKX82]WNC30924.1 hypothetical protein RHH53_05070 [Thermosynechococcus sp. PKX82]